MNIQNNEYNPKITFRFLENIWQKRNHRESEVYLKAIYQKKNIPHTFTEMMFSKALNAYEIICNGEKINEHKVNSIVSLYKPRIIDNDETKKAILILTKKIEKALNNDSNWQKNFLEIFKFCILCKQFKDYEIELAKFFSNYSLIVNGKPPIIMYCYLSDKMADSIRNRNSETELHKMMNILIQRTQKFNIIHKVKSLHSIKEEIYKIHEELVNEYGIVHLSIFGSYARNEATKYSDLDIVCNVRKDFKSIENYQDKIALRIKEEIDLEVDVMIDDETYDKNQIPIDIYKEKINLF